MTESVVDYNEQPLAVEVDATTMIFNMASDSLTSLKECFIKLAKHELFFEEFRALKHISFDIHRGEIVGLVGTNGSGSPRCSRLSLVCSSLARAALRFMATLHL